MSSRVYSKGGEFMSNRIKNIHYGTQRQQLKNLTKKEYQAL